MSMSEPDTCPAITVIIPVWNGAERIGATLTALDDQTASRNAFEVIVVDNGSIDDTAERVRRFADVRLLSEPQPGSYRARNTAVDAARGKWLLFTDGDCVPAADWIEHAIAAASDHPDAGVIGGRIDLFREAGGGDVAFEYERMMAFDQRRNIAERRCVTANWLCRRQTLVKLGGFNADLLSGGDVEMSNRISDAGLSMAYAHDMVINHPSRTSLSELIAKRRRTMGGRFTLQRMQPRQLPYWLKTLTKETLAHMSQIEGRPLSVATKVKLSGYFLLLLATAQAELVALTLGKRPYRS